MPRISIISPVYNVGKYIPKFLHSLESQTYQDFEIIFVYDSSLDESLQLVDDFCKKDSFKERAKIIKNGEKKGVGYAKDLGFNNVSLISEYVIFLDSDDYFDDDYLEALINKADETGSDITCCGFSRINEEDGSLICKEMINNPDNIVLIKDLDFPLFLINTAVWNKLFRKTIIKNCRFGFVKHAEDLYFLLEALCESKSICFINESKYTYLIHEGSLINTMSYEKYQDTCEHFLDFSKYRDNKQLFELISAFVFLRIGIGTTIRVCQNKETKRRIVIRESKKFLKDNFKVFKNNKYLSFNFLKKSGKKGIAIWLLKVLYKMNLIGIAFNMYILKMKKSKKEIRW